MDLSIFKTVFEKITLKIKTLISLKGEVNVDNRKLEFEENIKLEQTYQNAPITNNTIVLLDPSSVNNVLDRLNNITATPPEVPVVSVGEATLPEVEQGGKPKKLLEEYFAAYKENKQLYLDRGKLLFFYEERLNVDFSAEELVFLMQSSFKNDFPFWFWAFLYREKFNNVVPLFEKAYETEDLKIRLKIVEAMGRFTNTSEDIVSLAHSEENEKILGAIVVELSKDEDDTLAQRVITNAISRKLIPDLEYAKIKTLKAELGKKEKEYLYSIIKNGWPPERVKVLNILSATVSDEDLPALESLLEKETGEVSLSVLHCIARIGKTTKQDIILKYFLETRWDKFFIQGIETITAIKDRSILPQLLEWLKNTSTLTRLYNLTDWKIRDYLKSAIHALIDKEFYEKIVQDILSVPSTNHRKYYLWDQFNILGDVRNKEIIELIKKETRLLEYPEWHNLLEETMFNDAMANNNKQALIDLVDTSNYTNTMLSLRELWKTVNLDEVAILRRKIEVLREDLRKRLQTFALGDYPKKIKVLAKNDLDFFLDENQSYHRVWDTKKLLGSGEEDSPFSKLISDISHFSIIEKEYVVFMLKKKDASAKQLLIEYLGRPFEAVYRAINPKWKEITKNDVSEKLLTVIRTHENPLIRLEALKAAFRMKILTEKQAKEIATPMWTEAREVLKKSENRSDEWFIAHMIYYNAIDVFVEIADIEDFPIIEESVNNDRILYRHFGRYVYFHNANVIRKLFEILELTEDSDEIKEINSALDTLDYDWTKEVLNIES